MLEGMGYCLGYVLVLGGAGWGWCVGLAWVWGGTVGCRDGPGGCGVHWVMLGSVGWW